MLLQRRKTVTAVITAAAALADPGGVLGVALERRKPATEGGAYSVLLQPRAPFRRGALSGVPLAVKDLIDVAGTPTRAGSRVFSNAPAATADAFAVARLRAAGAAVVGKTALHEVAFGTTGINEYEGTPLNPSDRTRICGGSSSGSAAAVAEGSAAIALGTDTGGSVRIPAALCGVVGFKPSFGCLSTVGVLPLATSLDHVGVLAADVASTVAAFAAITSTASRRHTPLRSVGLDALALASASRPVAEAIERALKSLNGIRIQEISLPDSDLVMATSTTILFSEAAAQHQERFRLQPDRYGVDVQQRLSRGGEFSSASYQMALAAAKDLTAVIVGLLGEVDVIIGPTVPIVAPRLVDAVGDARLPGVLVEHTRLANVTGLPCVSLPVPSEGLPVGLQILGLHDESVLSVAAQLERLLSQPAPGQEMDPAERYGPPTA